MTIEKPHKHATIGKRIQSIRSGKGLSQTKFAVNIGISQRFLSDLETGRIKPPMPLLLAIEYVYKYRKEWVMTGDEPAHMPLVDGPLLLNADTSDRQALFWRKKLERILRSGDRTKIEAIKGMLKALDPGEKPLEGLGGGEDEDAGPQGSDLPSLKGAILL
ncbi:MAG: helix-turn-helix transcriptional regulator [Nitrospiraceae bacterium]|nr:helix-turn-helix transcriptional regulator [Nitrospiraceae bacterium]